MRLYRAAALRVCFIHGLVNGMGLNSVSEFDEIECKNNCPADCSECMSQQKSLSQIIWISFFSHFQVNGYGNAKGEDESNENTGPLDNMDPTLV